MTSVSNPKIPASHFQQEHPRQDSLGKNLLLFPSRERLRTVSSDFKKVFQATPS